MHTSHQICENTTRKLPRRHLIKQDDHDSTTTTNVCDKCILPKSNSYDKKGKELTLRGDAREEGQNEDFGREWEGEWVFVAFKTAREEMARG